MKLDTTGKLIIASMLIALAILIISGHRNFEKQQTLKEDCSKFETIGNMPVECLGLDNF